MTGHPTAAVICRNGITRDAIVRSLRPRFASVIDSFAEIADAMPRDAKPDVVVFAETSASDFDTARDTRALEAMRDLNWVVICADKSNPVYSALRRWGARVSALPNEIADDELGHVVRLSAHRRSVCVDDACEACPAVERSILMTHNLDATQWDLLRELADGHPNKVIARHLNCAESTVKARVRVLMGRLGVLNRTQAAVIAARAGLSARNLNCAGKDVQSEGNRTC